MGQDGSFQLQARPGTYGVIAVADADKSGSVTDQDLVGWKGQENPEGPDDLTVRPGETVDAGEIALSVKELLGEADRRPAVLAGRVTGAELARAARVAVSLYSDEELKSLVTIAGVGPDARFCVALEPGTYYAKATVDLEGDGRLSAGDMLGFFGVADIMSGERPQPLALGMGELRVEVVIPLTAQLDDEGKLVAIKAANDAAEDAE